MGVNKLMQNLEAYLNWKHDPICKRNHSEWLRYEKLTVGSSIEHTLDGGVTWHKFPWKMNILGHIDRVLHRAEWPPFIACFGWYDGRIAIAWNSLDESEIFIGKFLALFDQKRQCWTFQYLGYFDLEDGVLGTWFENIGFEIFNRTKPKGLEVTH